MPVPPNKTDSPLIVNPYRVLPFSFSSQRFQVVSGRRRKNAQLCGSVQLQQFPQRDSLEGPESPRVLIMEQFLGVLARKALNHTSSVVRGTLYVNDS